MKVENGVTTWEINDVVEWTSQAGGRDTKKVGKVFAIVPANRRPYHVLEDVVGNFNGIFARYNVHAIDSRSGHRKVESYIIEVPGKGRPQLYWPLASKLVLHAS